MRQLLFLIFFSILLMTEYVSLFAETLLPPPLKEVLKENERKQKIQARNVRVSKFTVSPATRDDFSYYTLQSSGAVTISRYTHLELWVQEVDLAKGGYIKSILTLGGYDEVSGEPLFEKKKLSEVKSGMSDLPFSIFNGQFFDPRRSITPLSFGVKVDGVVRTAGADNRNEPKNILILEKDTAKIVPYSWENLRDAAGYFALVSRTLERSHYSNESIGRTYMCLRNPNSNNESSTLLIFTATAITEPVIESEMIRWGCTKSASSKLDSSGSTRLWVAGEYIFGKSHKGDPDYRSIPQSLAVYASR